MRYVYIFVAITMWLAGIVIAKGFWWTLLSLIPIVAWYNVVEKLLQMWGLV